MVFLKTLQCLAEGYAFRRPIIDRLPVINISSISGEITVITSEFLAPISKINMGSVMARPSLPSVPEAFSADSGAVCTQSAQPSAYMVFRNIRCDRRSRVENELCRHRNARARLLEGCY